jgi:hypothetical protein
MVTKGGTMKTINSTKPAKGSNLYYAGLNRRFDKRAKRLRRCGWTYEHTEFGGMWTKRRPMRVKAIAASLVMHADNYVFWDAILREGKRVNPAVGAN